MPLTHSGPNSFWHRLLSKAICLYHRPKYCDGNPLLISLVLRSSFDLPTDAASPGGAALLHWSASKLWHHPDGWSPMWQQRRSIALGYRLSRGVQAFLTLPIGGWIGQHPRYCCRFLAPCSSAALEMNVAYTAPSVLGDRSWKVTSHLRKRTATCLNHHNTTKQG